MEIDITHIVRDVDTWPLSGSVATHGLNAGPMTWAASVAQAKDTPLLDTPEKLDALRDWAEGFGAWSREEIAAWSDDECNALLLQYIAGDMREMGMDGVDMSDDDEAARYWRETDEDRENGRIPSNIYPGDDGRIYFYLGS